MYRAGGNDVEREGPDGDIEFDDRFDDDLLARRSRSAGAPSGAASGAAASLRWLLRSAGRSLWRALCTCSCCPSGLFSSSVQRRGSAHTHGMRLTGVGEYNMGERRLEDDEGWCCGYCCCSSCCDSEGLRGKLCSRYGIGVVLGLVTVLVLMWFVYTRVPSYVASGGVGVGSVAASGLLLLLVGLWEVVLWLLLQMGLASDLLNFLLVNLYHTALKNVSAEAYTTPTTPGNLTKVQQPVVTHSLLALSMNHSSPVVGPSPPKNMLAYF
ncbi:hypothetical protein Pelo_15958 [Pelomyxa schiedti]|nr:hypothetical protein Pelo_15958 [Pelomyxa schiedti]